MGCSAWPPIKWPASSGCVSPNESVASYSVPEKLDHGHHVMRICCKNLVGRMYEEFSTFLRVEVCVNRMKDLGLNKGLENLECLRRKLAAITDPFAGFERNPSTCTSTSRCFNAWLCRSWPAKPKSPVSRFTTALRHAQDESSRTTGTHRTRLPLPPHRQRDQSRAHRHPLPPARLRTAGELAVPSPARRKPKAQHQDRSRLLQSRSRHSTGARSARRLKI